ncbi:hypothetical protein GCM10023144_05180 [Pigmentiphaga soli]|uniref:Polyketide cyclase n=1 Tax=Pigmentiphaga soli TaxID=1007095 RepID=A0ABP8GH92_9BURK
MTTHPFRILGVGIDRPHAEVAAFLADPRNFPLWASGLAGGLERLAQAGTADEWVADGADGRVTMRFSPPNDFGVADHWVTLPDGTTVYVPLRAVADGDGALVTLTLFRLPGMDDARFEADGQWIERDLASLKRVLESR